VIKHIVFWTVEEEDKQGKMDKIKSLLEALPREIPQIQELEVGFNFNPSEVAYDVALYSVFTSEEDLQTYQVHPKHKEAAAYVGSVTTNRKVVDYRL